MQPPVLRPVSPADAPAILAIYAPQVLHGSASWEYEPPSLPEMERRIAAIIGQGFPYLVAEIDGALAGYSYASSYRPREGYRFVVENSIYVDPAFQGHGLGRSLLNALIEQCAARGFRQMVAIIGDSQNHASIRLHRACGFVHVGTLTGIGYKHERWLDSVIMQRSLVS
jgi:L-amino acid N-acyltransferase YncA